MFTYSSLHTSSVHPASKVWLPDKDYVKEYKYELAVPDSELSEWKLPVPNGNHVDVIA